MNADTLRSFPHSSNTSTELSTAWSHGATKDGVTRDRGQKARCVEASWFIHAGFAVE